MGFCLIPFAAQPRDGQGDDDERPRVPVGSQLHLHIDDRSDGAQEQADDAQDERVFQRIPWRKPCCEVTTQQAEHGTIAEDEQDESGTDEQMAFRKDAGAFKHDVGSGMRDEDKYQPGENRADAFQDGFHNDEGLVMGLVFFKYRMFNY